MQTQQTTSLKLLDPIVVQLPMKTDPSTKEEVEIRSVLRENLPIVTDYEAGRILGVATEAVNKARRRNPEKFVPKIIDGKTIVYYTGEFGTDEREFLCAAQIAAHKNRGSTHGYTLEGLYVLATCLQSPRAIAYVQVSAYVMAEVRRKGFYVDPRVAAVETPAPVYDPRIGEALHLLAIGHRSLEARVEALEQAKPPPVDVPSPDEHPPSRVCADLQISMPDLNRVTTALRKEMQGRFGKKRRSDRWPFEEVYWYNASDRRNIIQMAESMGITLFGGDGLFE